MKPAPSHRRVGDPQSTGVPFLLRLPLQMQEAKSPSAWRRARFEHRRGHLPHEPSPELQRTGR